ncbi:MAG: rubrerythrin family protein [Bacteroidales bacterium]|nr:rubrerythrin family protein [Bacteroidales bacterium]
MKTMNRLSLFALVILIALTGCTSKREKTIENIKLGIKSETTTSAKYAAYGQKALDEGHVTIARLFKAASKAEAIHAANHASVLKTFKAEMDDFIPKYDVKSTAENLQEAINGEKYEVNTMYPLFLEDAKSKKIKKATIESLTWALASEKKHLALFTKALDALNAKTELQMPFNYLVCPVCGDTYDKASAPKACESCGADRELFLDIK